MRGCNTACPPGYDFAVHRWDYQGKPVMHGGTPEKPPMVRSIVVTYRCTRFFREDAKKTVTLPRAPVFTAVIDGKIVRVLLYFLSEYITVAANTMNSSLSNIHTFEKMDWTCRSSFRKIHTYPFYFSVSSVSFLSSTNI